jgi:hypothetical protein
MQVAGEVPEKKDLNVADDEHDLVEQTGETGMHDIEVGKGALKRLAEDTYDSDDVAIREILTNAETACKLAVKQEGDRYSPVIEVEYQHNGVLTVRDNGIGMTTAVFDKVVRVATHTTNGDKGDVSGQMGMGLYSIRNITKDAEGDEGETGCTLSTHSRESGENYKVYMTDRGFNPIPGGLGENEYGTEINIPVKRDFGNEKVRDSVAKYAEYFDVPVLYTEYDEDDNEVFDEEYGNKNLEDQYPNDEFVAVYEDDCVKVVSTEEAKEQTLLCNAPINRNDPGTRSYHSSGTYQREAKYPWDLKIKHEDGREWENGFDLPKPTSDRDRLSTNGETEFFKAVSAKAKEAHYDKIAEIFEDIGTAKELIEFAGSNPAEFGILSDVVNSITRYSQSPDGMIDRVEDEVGVTITRDVAKILVHLHDDMDHAKRKYKPSKKSSRDEKKVWEVIQGVGEDADVYMGKSISRKKTKAVWNLHEDNEVVRLEQGTTYEEMEETFGWKKLKDVDIDEHKDELSESVLSEINAGSNSGKDAAERDIVVRLGTKDKVKLSARDLVDKLKSAHSTSTGSSRGVKIGYSEYVDKVVIFPPNSDHSISSWHKFFSDNAVTVAAATVGTKMVEEYLQENAPDNAIMHIDDISTNAKDVEVTTTEGNVTLGDEKDRLLLHLISDEKLLQRFRDDDVMENMEEFVNEQFNLRSIDDEDTDILYAPVHHKAAIQLKVGMKEMRISVYGPDVDMYKFASKKSTSSHGKGFNAETSEELYVIGRFDKWNKKSSEVVSMRKAARKDGETVLPLVDMMTKFHDNDIEPVSESPGEVELKINGKQTSLGETVAPNSSVADD